MKIKILVAAHKKFPMPADTEIYMPILVGATKNYHPGINYQRDDQGKNISLKNPNYNELTAVYWAWKNLDADVIGVVHYRRFLSLHRKRDMKSILKTVEIENLLRKAPIILPCKRKYYIETNYSHYVHAHHREPLDMTRKVIAERTPTYIDAFDQVMNSRSAHMFNMMIMKKDFFDQYAAWLFDILFEVESRIDIKKYSMQEARVYGYLSELLMDVWLRKNNLSYIDVNWIQLGNRHILSKSINFICRKLDISSKKRTHF